MATALDFWDRADGVGSDGCWTWREGKCRGYGSVLIWGARKAAHRVAYELVRGPIPDGYEVHHECRTRACVNPSHLEALPASAHRARTYEQVGLKTHCAKGHEFAPENTGYETKRSGSVARKCKACRREASRLARRRPR